MRDLSRAVQEGLDGVHYATMVAVGWHGPRRLLVLTNAGHPPPCWYRLVVLYTDGVFEPPTRLETSWVVTG